MGVDQSVGPSGSFFIQGSNNYNTENINILLAPKNGNVGIGTLVPTETLDVDGNIFVNGKVKFGATNRQLIDLYNDAYAIGTQTDTQYSDPVLVMRGIRVVPITQINLTPVLGVHP